MKKKREDSGKMGRDPYLGGEVRGERDVVPANRSSKKEKKEGCPTSWTTEGVPLGFPQELQKRFLRGGGEKKGETAGSALGKRKKKRRKPSSGPIARKKRGLEYPEEGKKKGARS